MVIDKTSINPYGKVREYNLADNFDGNKHFFLKIPFFSCNKKNLKPEYIIYECIVIPVDFLIVNSGRRIICLYSSFIL